MHGDRSFFLFLKTAAAAFKSGRKKVPCIASSAMQGTQILYAVPPLLLCFPLPVLHSLSGIRNKTTLSAYNGATGPDWGRSELVFGYFRPRYFHHIGQGLACLTVSLSEARPYLTLLFFAFSYIFNYRDADLSVLAFLIRMPSPLYAYCYSMPLFFICKD